MDNSSEQRKTAHWVVATDSTRLLYNAWFFSYFSLSTSFWFLSFSQLAPTITTKTSNLTLRIMKTNPRSCLALERSSSLKRISHAWINNKERCYFFHQSLPHSPLPSWSHCLNSDSHVSIQRKLSSSPPAFCVRLMKNSTHCSPVRSTLSSLQRNWQSFKSPALSMEHFPSSINL